MAGESESDQEPDAEEPVLAVTPQAPPRRASRLVIPTVVEASSEYKARIGALLARPDTHVYIDTSLLMWATKIGPASRSELLGWLRTDLGDRAHVPTWSAHEYLRHHVAGTIVDELVARSTEVSQIAGSTFAYFRPFLDDPALPAAEGYERLRASTRDAINTFNRLVEAAKNWRRAYPAHAEQIIEYINECVIEVGTLYDDLPAIATAGAARYEGRIPPGFQDRNKKGDAADDDPDDASAGGANRYGDLIFWKEAMAHAAASRAKAVIILTNDRKNDWRMGGENRAPIDDVMLSWRRSWRPVPRIHPMLALEASLAGIDEVALIDSQYLAAYLREVDEERVGAFADVAIVPDPPAPETEGVRRARAVEHRLAEDLAEDAERSERETAAAVARAIKEGYRFLDDPTVQSTKAAMKRALIGSRQVSDERVTTIIRRLRADVEPAEPVDTVVTQEGLAGMDHIALATFARGLHDLALAGQPGYTDPLVDLIGLLQELSPATASALLLGLLASMYLETGTGTSRIPPASPAAPLLLALLGHPFADTPSQVIAGRLTNNSRRPLHMPTEARVECRFDIEPETTEPDELRSLKIAGVETLTLAQEDNALRLRALIGADVASGKTIMSLAAELFTLPVQLLDASGDEATEYRLTEMIGFRPPKDVSRNKEER